MQDKLEALERVTKVAAETPLVIAHPQNADLFADTLVGLSGNSLAVP